jgi:hypothetical protein
VTLALEFSVLQIKNAPVRILLLLRLSTVTSAQEANYKFDCSTLITTSPGCISYNEMVQNKDTDLLTTLRNNATFVCFRPIEDVFFTLAYTKPDDSSFAKVGSTQVYEADGFIYYDRYKSGIDDDNFFVYGKWKRVGKDKRSSYFESLSGTPARGHITDNEIGIAQSFKNRMGTNTTYTVAVRRSTSRFVETHTWKNSQEPVSKGKASPQKQVQPSEGSNDISGYCVYFSATGP